MGLAQNDRSWIRQGNAVYAEEDYNQAAEYYYRAIDANRENPKAYFNLGNTQFKNGDTESARKNFMRAFEEASDREVKGKAWHNIGNTYLQEQKFQEAVNAYKNALLHNPTDEESRHNLAFAQSKLQQQQENQNNDQNKQDQDRDKEGDQESEDEGKQEDGESDKQEGENQQDQNGDNEKEQQDQNDQDSDSSEGESNQEKQQPQEGQGEPSEGMSREEAERLLRAIENQERQVQGRVTEKKAKGSTSETERDW
jgi:tetratricopeptide (TPR) repeat protein